jgi:hypothetical protein
MSEKFTPLSVEMEKKPQAFFDTPVSHTPEKDFELDLTVQRLKRHLEVGALIDAFETGEAVSDEQRLKAAAMIDGRGWNTLFTHLQTGDQMVTFLVPGAEFSIKHLNDDIFGPQGTDDIIEHQKTVLREVMLSYGFEPLRQDYKTGIFKINEATPEILTQICETVRAAMDTFVAEKIRARRAELTKKGQSTEFLKKFEERTRESGYKLSFGMSEVGDPYYGVQDYSHVELTVLQSLQAAKVAQKNHGQEYGRVYQPQDILVVVDETEQLREEIRSLGEVVVDKHLGPHVIFSFDQVTKTYQLSRDLLRLLRKGTFQPKGEHDKKIIALLDTYRQRINILDVVKPFTHGEISGHPVEEGAPGVYVSRLLDQEMHTADDLRNTFFPADKKTLKMASEILRRDQKDASCTSPAVFHREALATPQCTYICIDVLDVGVDLLLSYEQSFQKIAKAPEDQKDTTLFFESLSAGDEMTSRLRAIRANVRSFCEEALQRSSVPLLIGGDEITLALPSEVVTSDFLFGLRSATGARVVASEVERAKSAIYTEEELYKQHSLALKEAETAVGVAKKIEEALSSYGRHHAVPGVGEVDESVTRLFGEIRSGFVVSEEQGVFMLLTKEKRYPLAVDQGMVAVDTGSKKMLIYSALAMLFLVVYLWS